MRLQSFYRRKACLVAAVALLVGIAMAMPAQADVIFGQSDGYGLDLHVSFGGPPIDVNQAAYSAGAGVSPYTNSNSVVNVSVSDTFLQLDNEVMTSDVSSDVDGLPGNRTVTGSSEVNSIAFDAFFGFATGDASLITADASVTGDYGALVALGSASLANANITINGVPLIIPVNPTPNYLLYNALGVTILLNEQILTGDGISTAGIDVNAIHITLNNVGGVADGDIIAGHASASAIATGPAVVPEPASISLLVLGTAVMLFKRRRNDEAVAA